jgi:predicted amidohydrolase YtcJ
MAAARRAGIRVVGHAPRNLGMDALFTERQDALAHAEEFIYAWYAFHPRSSQVPPDVEARTHDAAWRAAAAGTWIVPNLVAYKGIAQQAENIAPVLARDELRFVPWGIRASWEPARNSYVQRFSGQHPRFWRWYGVLTALTAALANAGVPLMAGTDAPIPSVVPGYSLHDELQELVAAGLTPFQALEAATVAPARFLRQEAQWGTIAAGSRADLLLVGGNPLDDLARLRAPAGVMVAGRWLDRDRLQSLRTELARYAGAPE